MNRLSFIGFIMIGVAGTMVSERVNVHILKSWAYTESMPMIPLLDVGLDAISPVDCYSSGGRLIGKALSLVGPKI